MKEELKSIVLALGLCVAIVAALFIITSNLEKQKCPCDDGRCPCEVLLQ